MRPHSIIFLAFLLITAVGCGDESGFDPNESESSKAIRAKVRAKMEIERLQRQAPRIAHATAAAAAAATATSVPSDGSSSEDETEAAPVGERGSALYAQNCSSCHGLRGAGDGPVGASLVPQPARHNDGEYMNALPNEHLFMVIKEGGPAIGKSPTMAAWGSTMSDDQINDVIVFVRSLSDPPYTGPLP